MMKMMLGRADGRCIGRSMALPAGLSRSCERGGDADGDERFLASHALIRRCISSTVF